MNPSARKLVAILFADIAGYTAIMQRDESEAMSLLQHYQDVLSEYLKKYGGEVIKNYGDGSICVLPTASDCLKCAKGIQLALKDHPPVPLRIGLHVGDVIFKDGDVYGDAVNLVSRIESMGIPGNILMSRSFYQKVKNQAEFSFKSMGIFDFKNIEEPIEVFALTDEGISIPERKNLKGKFKAQKGKLKNWLWGLAFLMIASIGLVFWMQMEEPMQTLDSPFEVSNSIAILPFENLSDDRDQEYLAKGVSVELGNLLSRIPALKVVPSKFMKEVKIPTKEIYKEYGINYILNGTTFPKNEMIEINIELINANSGVTQWSSKFEDSLSMILSLQDKIIRELGAELRFKLQELSLINQDPKNAELYLNWLQYVNLFIFSTQSRERVIKEEIYLKRAYQIDSTYLPILDGLIENNNTKLAWKLIDYDTYKSNFDLLVNKMVEIDSNSHYTLWCRAIYEKDINLDFAKAYQLFFELANHPLRVMYFYSGAGYQLARYDLKQGKQIIEEAMKADPLHLWNYQNMAEIYYWEGKLDQSLAMWKKFGEIIRDTNIYEYYQIKQGWLRNDTTDIDIWIEKTSEDEALQGQALNAGIKGNKEEFESIMTKYIDKYGINNIDMYFISSIYAHLGYHDKAFEWLEKAWKNKCPYLFELKVDPFFKKLHQDPRWAVFLDKVGFPASILD